MVRAGTLHLLQRNGEIDRILLSGLRILKDTHLGADTKGSLSRCHGVGVCHGLTADNGCARHGSAHGETGLDGLRVASTSGRLEDVLDRAKGGVRHGGLEVLARVGVHAITVVGHLGVALVLW